MRRKEQEIKDQKIIDQIFEEADIFRLGLMDGEFPYIVPMNFAYKDKVLYFHGSKAGKRIELIRKNNNACFEIDIAGKIERSDQPCNWGVDYKSIIGVGKVSIIEDINEKIKALQLIMLHYSGKNNWEFKEAMINATEVFKLETEKMTCKRSN